MVRGSRARGTGTYDKPPLTLGQLVARLQDRGLAVPDRDRAIRYLRHLGYYRLSPYTVPFQMAGTNHQFRPDVTFDDVLDLYVFDRALRLLILDTVERVEVAIRSSLTDHMSITYDDPHWYVDPAHFAVSRDHSGLLRGIEKTCEEQLGRAAELHHGDNLVFRSALEHYLTMYGAPALPPSWLMVETLTIGSLERAVRNLKRRSDKTAIAKTIGINAVLLDSWLRTYVRVRNICAHHGRVWNVGIGVYPAIPTSHAVSWLEDKSALAGRRAKQLYPVLVSLQSVLDTISPRSTWAHRLSDLIAQHPHLPLGGLGMPENWRDDRFWARHIRGHG